MQPALTSSPALAFLLCYRLCIHSVCETCVNTMIMLREDTLGQRISSCRDIRSIYLCPRHSVVPFWAADFSFTLTVFWTNATTEISSRSIYVLLHLLLLLRASETRVCTKSRRAQSSPPVEQEINQGREFGKRRR